MRLLPCAALLAIVGQAFGGTISVTDSPAIDLEGGGQARFTINHVYDDSTYELIDWSWAVSSDPIIRVFSAEVEVVPPSFLDPPVFEMRTVTETVEILQWIAKQPWCSVSRRPTSAVPVAEAGLQSVVPVD